MGTCICLRPSPKAGHVVQGVEVLDFMSGISEESAPIIRAYIDLNLETLFNVRRS